MSLLTRLWEWLTSYSPNPSIKTISSLDPFPTNLTCLFLQHGSDLLLTNFNFANRASADPSPILLPTKPLGNISEDILEIQKLLTINLGFEAEKISVSLQPLTLSPLEPLTLYKASVTLTDNQALEALSQNNIPLIS